MNKIKHFLIALSTLLIVTGAFGQATIEASFDVNSGSSPTEPGFEALNNTINGTQNGITLTTTPDFNGGTGYRNRGTNGALADAAQQALMQDLRFMNSNEPYITEVTFALTGLEANRQYEITYFTYNAGAFQRQVSFYESSSSGPYKGSFTANGQDPDSAHFIFTIAANANGEATFVAVGDDPSQSSVVFNGMTIGLLPITAPPQPLEITEFIYDKENDNITVTWKSNPGQTYGLYWSDDLETFEANIDPEIPAHASDPVTTFGPFLSPVAQASELFFRVGDPDFEDPALSNVVGNNSTITITFSEAMAQGPATDISNYIITEDGAGTITLASAVLSSDGLTITLTTESPLGIGTSYSVEFQNLTDQAGRSLPPATTDTFATWDNDPTGVKVFILAGQSNMQGHGRNEEGNGGTNGAIGSLRYEVDNDAANYGQLVDAQGDWVVRDDVKLWWRNSDINSSRTVKKGNLDPTFGVDAARFGPEYGFGWVLGEYYDEPVLLLKVAWGGKSLDVDFRPPSAVTARGGEIGPYYTGMLEYARDVLSNLGTEFPEWAGMGYQIVGFGWHQGWNDGGSNGPYEDYEANLVDLINDIRAEFSTPDLPISIANSGFGGFDQTATSRLAIMEAQLAVADPTQHPEFTGTVFTAETRGFWREASVSPRNQGYHWNQNGETYWLIGQAMGEGMVDLLTAP